MNRVAPGQAVRLQGRRTRNTDSNSQEISADAATRDHQRRQPGRAATRPSARHCDQLKTRDEEEDEGGAFGHERQAVAERHAGEQHAHGAGDQRAQPAGRLRAACAAESEPSLAGIRWRRGNACQASAMASRIISTPTTPGVQSRHRPGIDAQVLQPVDAPGGDDDDDAERRPERRRPGTRCDAGTRRRLGRCNLRRAGQRLMPIDSGVTLAMPASCSR